MSIYKVYIIIRRNRENNRKIENRIFIILFNNRFIIYVIDIFNKEIDIIILNLFLLLL